MNVKKSDIVETGKHAESELLTQVGQEIWIYLNGIYGPLKIIDLIIKQGLPDIEKIKTLTDRAVDSANHLISLSEDLLDGSKIEESKLEFNFTEISLNEIVDQAFSCLEVLTERNNLELILHCHDKVSRVRADRNRLEQVMFNLLVSALKFTEQGNVMVCCRDLKESVEVSISDAGCGFASQDLPKIFDYFQMVKKNKCNTGLELLISKQLVEKMGGTVKFESEFAKGSVFSFTLPIWGQVKENGDDRNG